MKFKQLRSPKIANRSMTLSVVVVMAMAGILAFAGGDASAATKGCSNKVFARGSSGVCVKDIQKLLNYEAGTHLKVNGVFGASTKSAVIKAQHIAGIRNDGVVGSKTFKAMCTSNKLVDNRYTTKASNRVRQAAAKVGAQTCQPKYIFHYAPAPLK